MITLTRFLARISHSIEPRIEYNQFNRLTDFQILASRPSTTAYEGQFNTQGNLSNNKKHSNQFMKKINGIKQDLSLSSIGIGTYKGQLTQKYDIVMFNAIVDSCMFGVNNIDTCSNFRNGRSQFCVGKALEFLIQKHGYNRNQFFVASKAGYVVKQLPSQIAQGNVINSHCVHPFFLQQTLNSSLKAINVKTLDLFYLNNFAESQLAVLGWGKFEERLCQAFQFFEKSRKQNKIRYYGLSSWQSFRVNKKEPNHLNLEKVVKIAQKVGGINHGFKFIQTPINVMMPQAFADKNQPYGSLLQTAEALKINIISCSPILNGTLINVPLPADKLKCRYNGAKHLQFIRSIPSLYLVSTLIGQTQNRHVKKNLEVLDVAPLKPDEWLDMIVPKQAPSNISQQIQQ